MINLTHHYRAYAGKNPHPVKLYEGDDFRAACAALEEALPDEFFVEFAEHTVTGEPAVVFRELATKLTIGALYGVSMDEYVVWLAATGGFEQ